MGVSLKQWLSQCQVVTSCFTKEKEEDCKSRLPCQELCFVSTEAGGRGNKKSEVAIFLKNITLNTKEKKLSKKLPCQ